MNRFPPSTDKVTLDQQNTTALPPTKEPQSLTNKTGNSTKKMKEVGRNQCSLKPEDNPENQGLLKDKNYC